MFSCRWSGLWPGISKVTASRLADAGAVPFVAGLVPDDAGSADFTNCRNTYRLRLQYVCVTVANVALGRASQLCKLTGNQPFRARSHRYAVHYVANRCLVTTSKAAEAKSSSNSGSSGRSRRLPMHESSAGGPQQLRSDPYIQFACKLLLCLCSKR